MEANRSFIEKPGQYSVSVRKELVRSSLNLIQSDFGNYYGDEDNQGFCLETAIRERVYVLLRIYNYRHLLITAFLEASREDDRQAPLPHSYCAFCTC